MGDPTSTARRVGVVADSTERDRSASGRAVGISEPLNALAAGWGSAPAKRPPRNARTSATATQANTNKIGVAG
jgi:hypothetical protein